MTAHFLFIESDKERMEYIKRMFINFSKLCPNIMPYTKLVTLLLCLLFSRSKFKIVDQNSEFVAHRNLNF